MVFFSVRRPFNLLFKTLFMCAFFSFFYTYPRKSNIYNSTANFLPTRFDFRRKPADFDHSIASTFLAPTVHIFTRIRRLHLRPNFALFRIQILKRQAYNRIFNVCRQSHNSNDFLIFAGYIVDDSGEI